MGDKQVGAQHSCEPFVKTTKWPDKLFFIDTMTKGQGEGGGEGGVTMRFTHRSSREGQTAHKEPASLPIPRTSNDHAVRWPTSTSFCTEKVLRVRG